jgi:hypothetical protein
MSNEFNFSDFVNKIPTKKYNSDMLYKMLIKRCIYVSNFIGTQEDAKKDSNYFNFRESIYWMQVGAYLRSEGKI